MGAYMAFIIMNKKVIMKVIVVLLLLSSVWGGCSYINKQVGIDDEGPVEEFLEGIIYNQTGINMDLTPESPEDIE